MSPVSQPESTGSNLRYAVLECPQFPLQAVLRDDPEARSKPVALVDPARNTQVVGWMTQTAREAGVEIGQTPAQALARCSQLIIRRRSVAMESTAKDSLIGTAIARSPHVEWTAPGVCTLDLRGQPGLLDGSHAHWMEWMSRTSAAAGDVGLELRTGVAATPGVALQAAHWGSGMEVVQDARTFLAKLPFAALGPSSDVQGIVAGWGIRTVGEFLALGQAAVTDRLGLEALALWAAASPSATRPLRPVEEPVTFREVAEFDPGLESLEPLLFRLKRMLDSIEHRLQMAGVVAAEMDLKLGLEAGDPHERRLRVPHPTRRAEVLFRMLHTHLETVRTAAPVTSVLMEAIPARPHEKQFGLFETALKDPHQFQETLARLSALVGSDRVGTPVPGSSHRPGDFRLVPPDFENAPLIKSPRSPFGPSLAWRMLRPAPPAEVSLSGDTVARVQSAAGTGPARMVQGPWKLSGHWWDPAGAWSHESWELTVGQGRRLRVAKINSQWVVEAIGD